MAEEKSESRPNVITNFLKRTGSSVELALEGAGVRFIPQLTDILHKYFPAPSGGGWGPVEYAGFAAAILLGGTVLYTGSRVAESTRNVFGDRWWHLRGWLSSGLIFFA